MIGFVWRGVDTFPNAMKLLHRRWRGDCPRDSEAQICRKGCHGGHRWGSDNFLQAASGGKHSSLWGSKAWAHKWWRSCTAGAVSWNIWRHCRGFGWPCRRRPMLPGIINSPTFSCCKSTLSSGLISNLGVKEYLMGVKNALYATTIGCSSDNNDLNVRCNPLLG